MKCGGRTVRCGDGGAERSGNKWDVNGWGTWSDWRSQEIRARRLPRVKSNCVVILDIIGDSRLSML